MKLICIALLFPLSLLAAEPVSTDLDIGALRLPKALADKIVSLKRNAVLLKVSTEPSPHYLGGSPRIPDEKEWPSNDRVHMSFIGCFDLGRLNSDGYLESMPRNGCFLAYYDAIESAWGYDQAIKNYFKITHRETLAETELAMPKDLKREGIFKKTYLSAVRTLDWPTLDVQANNGVTLDAASGERYEELLKNLKQQNFCTKIGGYPSEIQGDMSWECQLVTNGLYCGDSSGYEDTRAKKLRAGAKDWNLLLQVDSVEAAGMGWGDSGMLYYWMKNSDLKESQWNRTWLISQCY